MAGTMFHGVSVGGNEKLHASFSWASAARRRRLRKSSPEETDG
jgi:hypothetical protein